MIPIIRATPDNAEAVWALFARRYDWWNLGFTEPPTQKTIRERLEAGYSFLATKNTQVVGWLELRPGYWDHSCDMLRIVRLDARCEGIAKVMAQYGEEYAFTQLGMHKVIAKVYSTNDEGMAMHLYRLSRGYMLEGTLRDNRWDAKHNRWADMNVYGLLRDDWLKREGIREDDLL